MSATCIVISPYKGRDCSSGPGSLPAFHHANRWSKQAHCHHEVQASEPSRGIKAQTEPGFAGNRRGRDVSNQMLAENGQCHNCDRKAKVNRMTLRSRCSAQRCEVLTLGSRNRGVHLCRRLCSPRARCPLRGFLWYRIKLQQANCRRHENQGI